MSPAFPQLVPVYSRAQGVLSSSALGMQEGEMVLGREVDGGSILFAGDTMVSRRHAVIRISADPWRIEIEDLGSKNGTFVNGRATRAQFLVDGDLLRIGDTFFVFRIANQLGVSSRDFPGRAPAVNRIQKQLEQLSVHRPWVLISGVEGADFEPLVEAAHRRINPEGSTRTVTGPGLASALGGVATVVLHNVDRLGPSAVALLKSHRDLAPVIATTTRDLESKVTAGAFDADLYKRFEGSILRMPPLRERREDLPSMIVQLLGSDAPPPTIDLIETLLLYAWDGDMEELVNVASELRVRGSGLDALMTDLVSPRLRGSVESSPIPDDSMTQVEVRRPVPSRPDLEGLLALHDGDVEAVAEALGRSRLQVMAWLQQVGLQEEDS